MQVNKEEIEKFKEIVKAFNGVKVDMHFVEAFKLVRLLEWLSTEIANASKPVEIKPLESPIKTPEKKNVSKSK
jgi:hypothetical protein